LTTNMIKNLHELYVYTIERTKEHTPQKVRIPGSLS
jgi:hypothetical protein